MLRQKVTNRETHFGKEVREATRGKKEGIKEVERKRESKRREKKPRRFCCVHRIDIKKCRTVNPATARYVFVFSFSVFISVCLSVCLFVKGQRAKERKGGAGEEAHAKIKAGNSEMGVMTGNKEDIDCGVGGLVCFLLPSLLPVLRDSRGTNSNRKRKKKKAAQ